MALYRAEQIKWEESYNLWEMEGSEWFPAVDSFENVIFERVLGKLHKLLVDEFFIPVYFDAHRGNQSFLIKPLEDNLEQIFNNGQNREYAVMIEHKLLSGGKFNRNHIKQVAETYERVKQLIFNNISYDNNWYNGRIESIITTKDNEAMISEILFNCTSREVSTNSI